MNVQLTRRNLIRSGLLATGAPLIPTHLHAAQPQLPVSPVPAPALPSPALLAGVQLTLGQIASRLLNRTSMPQDMQQLGQTLEMLNNHLFEETKFNSALTLAAQQMASKGLVFDPEAAAEAALHALKVYAPEATLAALQPILTISVEDSLHGYQEIQQHGLTRLLAHPQPQLSFTLPADMGDPDGTVFSLCPSVNFYLGGLASAAFVLQLVGCAPEPIFAILCPTVTVINLVLGVMAIAAWVLC